MRQADDFERAILGITPIMTFIYAEGNRSRSVESNASISCLKAIGASPDENAATGLSASTFYVSVLGTAVAAILSFV